MTESMANKWQDTNSAVRLFCDRGGGSCRNNCQLQDINYNTITCNIVRIFRRMFRMLNGAQLTRKITLIPTRILFVLLLSLTFFKDILVSFFCF